jgi:hypothetical protein
MMRERRITRVAIETRKNFLKVKHFAQLCISRKFQFSRVASHTIHFITFLILVTKILKQNLRSTFPLWLDSPCEAVLGGQSTQFEKPSTSLNLCISLWRKPSYKGHTVGREYIAEVWEAVPREMWFREIKWLMQSSPATVLLCCESAAAVTESL